MALLLRAVELGHHDDAEHRSRPEGPIPLAVLAKGPLRLSPRDCGFAMLDSGSEIIALVIGAGETWTLSVDGDRRVSGVLRPR